MNASTLPAFQSRACCSRTARISASALGKVFDSLTVAQPAPARQSASTRTRAILRRAFTLVHKDELIAIEQQPAGVRESVAPSIISELGDLFPRRRPAQREFKRAFHLSINSTGFTFQARSEMFALARDERA